MYWFSSASSHFVFLLLIFRVERIKKIGHCFYDTCNPTWCHAIRPRRTSNSILLLCDVRKKYNLYGQSNSWQHVTQNENINTLFVVFNKCFNTPHHTSSLHKAKERRRKINNSEFIIGNPWIDCVFIWNG